MPCLALEFATEYFLLRRSLRIEPWIDGNNIDKRWEPKLCCPSSESGSKLSCGKTKASPEFFWMIFGKNSAMPTSIG